jgi:hypothetical protein
VAGGAVHRQVRPPVPIEELEAVLPVSHG